MITSHVSLGRVLRVPGRILRGGFAAPGAVTNAWRSMGEAGRDRAEREHLAPGRDFDGTGNWLEAVEADDCWGLLAGCSLGRIGFTAHSGQPVILPVNYVVRDGTIVIRSGRGPKLAAARRGDLVAFEVDQINLDEHTGWSVTLAGRARWVSDMRELGRLAAPDHIAWAAGPRDAVILIEPVHIGGRRLTRPPASTQAV